MDLNFPVRLLQVFGNAPPSSMMEKFSDLLQFTTQVSRLMVTEIRRRASNKSTGEPSDTWTCFVTDANISVIKKPFCTLNGFHQLLHCRDFFSRISVVAMVTTQKIGKGWLQTPL